MLNRFRPAHRGFEQFQTTQEPFNPYELIGIVPNDQNKAGLSNENPCYITFENR